MKVDFIQGDNRSTQVGTRFKFYVEVHIFYESIYIYIVIKFIKAAAEVYAG